jgi:cytoskeletal protein RodZ
MTRTDVMASSRPQTLGAAPMRRGSTGILRRFVLLPVVLLMAIVLVGPSTALATGESTYGAKPNTPTTPKTGTSPSKESSSPKTSTPTSETSPTTTAPTTEAEKASTLPFTGFDLRWSVGIGLLLMGAGSSIVVMQRRQRREH